MVIKLRCRFMKSKPGWWALTQFHDSIKGPNMLSAAKKLAQPIRTEELNL